MKIQQIIETFENFSPTLYQEHYDNAGLLTGNPDWEVINALLTLDVTESVIREAIEKGCNLVIAHHPIIFHALKKLTGSNYVERTVILAIQNNIAIYAAHTNLDNMLWGVNDMICEKLGLIHRKILSPSTATLKKLYTFAPHADAEKVRQALFDAGAGNIGNYSEASFNVLGTGTFKGNQSTHPYVGEKGIQHQESETKIEVIFPVHLEKRILKALFKVHPYEEVAYDIISLDNTNQEIGSGMIGDLEKPADEKTFLEKIKRQMKAGGIRYTPLRGKSVKKVAVCGGAGSFLLKDAIREGADMFVSADFKYHEFFDADNQIVITDIGHFESEQFTVDIFYKILTEKFTTFAPLKSESRTNPINYLH
ncbi:MAG: Nif3-like dinuclear metal center hexameric protein [Chitinophagaceae bacterium]